MRSATRFALLFAAASLFSSPVFADFGGSIYNDTTAEKTDEFDPSQKDTLSVWVSSFLGERLRFDASARATISSVSPNLYADIEKFSLSGKFPPAKEGVPVFGFELGKFFQSDFTSSVFADSVVGLRFDFSYSRADLKVSFGYTGLSNKNYSSIILSRLDAIDDADDKVVLSSPRFIGILGLEFPELAARQTLTLSAVVQEDLRQIFDDVTEEGDETYDPTSGGRVDTQYWGIGLSGPLIPSLYYRAYAYLGTGRILTFEDDDQSTTGQSYQYEDIFSYMAGGSLRYYVPQFLKSAAAVKFLYASGDKDNVSYIEGNTKGGAGAFLPIADGAFGVAFTPKASNLMAAEFSYSLKPLSGSSESFFSSLQATAKVTPFYKPVAGVMSESEVDPSQDAGYLGTEIDASLNLRPFSDLGLGAVFGVFLPNGDMFVKDFDGPWYIGKLTASFSF